MRFARLAVDLERSRDGLTEKECHPPHPGSRRQSRTEPAICDRNIRPHTGTHHGIIKTPSSSNSPCIVSTRKRSTS